MADEIQLKRELMNMKIAQKKIQTETEIRKRKYRSENN